MLLANYVLHSQHCWLVRIRNCDTKWLVQFEASSTLLEKLPSKTTSAQLTVPTCLESGLLRKYLIEHTVAVAGEMRSKCAENAILYLASRLRRANRIATSSFINGRQ